MKYFTINSFVEMIKEEYPTLKRVVPIFHVKSLKDTMYRSKQGMPCLIKIFDEAGEQVLKLEDIITLIDEDFYISFKLSPIFKEDYVAVDIDATPIFNEKLDAMYYNRTNRTLTPKARKAAMDEYKKLKPKMNQTLDGEPFDI